MEGAMERNRNGWRRTRDGWLVASLWLSALLVHGTFVAADWARNRVLAPPLDDTFIHFQYAKQLARGRFFAYQDGEPVSTGATSFLYPVLLAPFWAAGLRGLRLIWAAHLLNFLGLALAATCVWATLRRMGIRRVGAYLGAGLVVWNGWLVWGVASGMAIGVSAGLLAWAIHELVRFLQGGGRRRFAVALALLSMVRPEGLVLAWALVGGLVACRAVALWRRATGRTWRWGLVAFLSGLRLPGWPIWLGLLVGLAPSVVLAILSGHLTTNGMLVKAHSAHDMSWVRYVWETGRTIAAVPGRLVWSPSAVGSAFMFLAVVTAWAGLAGRAREEEADGPSGGGLRVAGGTLWATVLAVCGVVAFYGFLIEHVEHHNRYYMPYVPLVAFLVALGAHSLGRGLGLGRTFPVAALGALLVMGVGSVGEWARIYARNCSDIAGHYLPMTQWMRRNLPPDAKVAVHDAGALFYLSGRRCYDMLGLVTNAFRPPGGARAPGFIWETLERIRPGYMVVYPNFLPGVSRLPILRRLHVERIAHVTIAGGREKTAYAIEWDRLADPEQVWGHRRAIEGLRLVDSLDQADRVSEGRHDFEIRLGRFRKGSSYRLASYHVGGKLLLDGARVHSGRESFTLRGLAPGRDLLLVVRFERSPGGPVRVSVNGRRVADWRPALDPASGEALLRVPGNLVRSRRVRVALDPRGQDLSVCHVFAFQAR